MKEYRIVAGYETTLALEKEINRLLKLGWKLSGGICATHIVGSGYASNGLTFFGQAMTRTTNEHGDVL